MMPYEVFMLGVAFGLLATILPALWFFRLEYQRGRRDELAEHVWELQQRVFPPYWDDWNSPEDAVYDEW